LVNTTIANLGQVIENRYILQLPNLARNSMSLAYLDAWRRRFGRPSRRQQHELRRERIAELDI
jgi:hypothetical protein